MGLLEKYVAAKSRPMSLVRDDRLFSNSPVEFYLGFFVSPARSFIHRAINASPAAIQEAM